MTFTKFTALLVAAATSAHAIRIQANTSAAAASPDQRAFALTLTDAILKLEEGDTTWIDLGQSHEDVQNQIF